MLYQLTWKTEPGLRGLACSGFRAVPAAAADNPAMPDGVAVEFASEEERDAFLRELEDYFAGLRFSNSAAAFETVKAYVLERGARKR